MNPIREAELIETRRHFFGRAATGLGAAALTSLINPSAFAAPTTGACGLERDESEGNHAAALWLSPLGRSFMWLLVAPRGGGLPGR